MGGARTKYLVRVAGAELLDVHFSLALKPGGRVEEVPCDVVG